MVDREKLQAVLKPFLWEEKDVIAVWEGGSSATGFADSYSDIDLLILCEDEAVEDLLLKVEGLLERHIGVTRKYRVPEPAWHGFSQCFYKLPDTHELFYVDLCFSKKSNPNRFTEPDRHGTPQVWFDREGALVLNPTPQEQVEKRCKALFQTTTGNAFVYLLEIKKAIARERFSDAFLFYFRFISQNFAALLNIKHRPEQADFGIRYAYRAYPKETADFLESLLHVDSLEQLTSHLRALEARFEALEKELAALYS